MDEFDLIHTLFAPLAKDFPGSLNLTDDAAILDVPPGRELIVTKDAITEGIHFLGNEDAALLAKKLLRVNLSDLAAMGATPMCYFLAILLPQQIDASWIKRFAEGLAEDQKSYGIHLAGGDTSAAKNDLSFSITAMGTVEKGRALRRSGALAGDHIYVSGTLGDSALGLMSLQHELGKTALEQRYFLPEPRLALGQKLVGIASACIDISDGLLQDLGHLCKASNKSAVVQRQHLPLSEVAQGLRDTPGFWEHIAGGGDDYELLFTAPANKADDIATLGKALSLPIAKIGHIEAKSGLQLLDEDGEPVPLTRQGFNHFSD